MTNRRGKFGALLAIAGLAFASAPAHAAPSQKPTPQTKRTQTKQAAPSQAQPAKDFPAISVTEVGSGKPFDLSTLGTLNKPVLVWFWAPT